ncbi:MAG: sel1 repeat family protein [Bacteroidales bacterium]|nr:sel1 repeat family protein [Candidatus Colimorpha pelethequi]
MKKALVLGLLLMPAMLWAQQIEKLQKGVSQNDTKAMITLAERYQCGWGVAVDSAKAYSLYQKAMELGNADAKAHVARYLLYYSGIQRDTAQALRLCQQAADEGSLYGLYRLGRAYLNGYGVACDTAKAYKLIIQAAESGDPAAITYMARAYYYGFPGNEPDKDKGISYALKADALGEYGSSDILFFYYFFDCNDSKKAWKYLNHGIEQGDIYCMTRNAINHHYGNGATVDDAKALQLLEEIDKKYGPQAYTEYIKGCLYSESSNPLINNKQQAVASFNRSLQLDPEFSSTYIALGKSYLYGTLFDADEAKALENFEKAFEIDKDATAAYFLGQMYLKGVGTEENDEKGVAYLLEGFKQYNIDAALALFDVFYNGYNNIPADPQRALAYEKKAADWGSTDALILLGRIAMGENNNPEEGARYFNEAVAKGNYEGYYYLAALEEQKENYKQAVKYLETGAKKGDETCNSVLGRLYKEGSEPLKIKPNAKKAEQYYIAANSPAGRYEQSMLYLNGLLGDQSEADINKGLGLLKQAAQEGNRDAIYWYGYCFETGTYVDVNYDTAFYYYKILADHGDAEGLFKMGLFYELGDGVELDSVKSIDYYTQAANQGMATAMCYLGDFYRIGRFVPCDSAKAFEYYMQAAQSEDDPAMGLYYVGRSYLEGCGVAKDTLQALAYLRKTAEMGVGNAASRLGDFFYNGEFVSRDIDSAMYYYMKGVADNNANCNYMLGKYLIDNNAYYEKAVEYLYHAAKKGHLEATLLFADCEQNGIGLQADPEDAYLIYENVARNTGNSEAYLNMGVARFQGLGCEQDYALAKTYFDSAAKAGNSGAIFNLGICYANGVGCDQDTVLAMDYFKQAAELNNIRALNLLGQCYQEGDGVPEDKALAVSYFERAMAQGSTEAMCNLGLCYEEGDGVVLNSKKAFELYTQAAEAGSARGCFMVANCYASGIYVREDMSKAATWYEKAAELGHLVAMYNLGIMYERGDGVEQNKKLSKKWLTTAAEYGYEPAQQKLNSK